MFYPKKYDGIVVGGGHAGIEASLVLARSGYETLLITLSLDHIGKMSCNPAIGGIGKGHMVRELDALGGEMGRAIDETGIQFRILNKSKGPAVWAPRAQADKKKYQDRMKRTLENQEGLDLMEDHVTDLVTEEAKDGRKDRRKKIVGVRTGRGGEYESRIVILTTGTFLRGLIRIGEYEKKSGRMGEGSAEGLSDVLRGLGFRVMRFNTGTPARIHFESINFDRVSVQEDEGDRFCFSHFTKRIPKTQIDCYITHTNERTHGIIRQNLDRSPVYKGKTSPGPRYCTSIETKVVRFPKKESHQIFLEPEGLDTQEVYLNGLATSLPEDVQYDLIRSIAGLEEAKIMRMGYDVDYDFTDPKQLRKTFESELVDGLYLAGQINGTSGYEEAAVQGLVAGLNGVRKLRGEGGWVLNRWEGYIGVLVDDLVNKGITEPYRMFTSRAEYRLCLRADNADERLMRYGYEFGLVKSEDYAFHREKIRRIHGGIEWIKNYHLKKEDFKKGKIEGVEFGDEGRNLGKLIKSGQVKVKDLGLYSELSGLSEEQFERIEVDIKYEGYIEKQRNQIKKFEELGKKRVPRDLNYDEVRGLLTEAREKLKEVRPGSLGEALGISGVNPSDIWILMMHLRNHFKRI